MVRKSYKVMTNRTYIDGSNYKHEKYFSSEKEARKSLQEEVEIWKEICSTTEFCTDKAYVTLYESVNRVILVCFDVFNKNPDMVSVGIIDISIKQILIF